jgi:hypothetical protein
MTQGKELNWITQKVIGVAIDVLSRTHKLQRRIIN